jgi:hypothetical protein
MASSLSWIDHDKTARERTQRILSLFTEKGVRDELGIGTIQTAIADQLFPGTSTLHSRLRYLFFVTWVYQRLAAEGSKPERIARLVKEREQEIIRALLEGGESVGVIGRRSREALERYPSSVYWAALDAMGIRLVPHSQDEFHRSFGKHVEPWDRSLPTPPADFPTKLTFKLGRDEAAYLRDKLCNLHGESLFAHLVVHGGPVADSEHVWDLPRTAMQAHHAELVEHGRCFAKVMYGAALLYNLLLAERAQHADWAATYEAALTEWGASRDAERLRAWRIADFWPLARRTSNTISLAAKAFVERWVQLAQSPGDEFRGETARAVVRAREMQLKGAQSRFRSERALRNWSGAAGAFVANYRWRTGRRFILDLFEAEI